MLEPALQVTEKLKVKTRNPKSYAFSESKDFQCSSQPARNNRKSKSKKSIGIDDSYRESEMTQLTQVSRMSLNSCGYCSTSHSSSFLESENDESLSLLSTSSSHSPSNSVSSKFMTHESTMENTSDLDKQYFGKNGLCEEVEYLQSPSHKNLNELEKEIKDFSFEVNGSTGVEPVLSDKIEIIPVNGKLKNSNYSKSSSEEYAYKRKGTSHKPKTFYNFTYKPEKDVRLNQPSLEKTVLYISDENKSSDSAKWETYFSSRPKSQFQSCSSQRFTATNVQNKPIKYSVLPKGFKVDYSVDRLFSFSEETFIDAHCHLDYLLDKIDYKATFTDYRRKYPLEFPPSYGGCVTVFCNPFSFSRTSQWKKLLSDECIWAAFGCHPKSADHYTDSVEDALCLALSHPQVRALGEIGLDYSDRSMCSKSKQKEVFKRQIILGLAFDLPLVIHCRDAYDDCLEILMEFVPRRHPIHLHCFTSEWSIAQKYLEAFPFLCIGVTNVVTFKSSWEIQEVVRNIPLDRLLLETDAPYFIPSALSDQFRVSHPGMAIFVAAKVASLKNISLKNVLMQTRRNTRKIYKI